MGIFSHSSLATFQSLFSVHEWYLPNTCFNKPNAEKSTGKRQVNIQIFLEIGHNLFIFAKFVTVDLEMLLENSFIR